MEITQQGREVAFIGVDALLRKLADIAVDVTSCSINDDLNDIVEQLYLLDDGLRRLRDERAYVDDCDVNRFIDMLRGV